VIAAVEGHAAGAGMCVAANCDIVVASTEAKFTCSFNKIGLLPDLGGLWSIPQRMGLGRAKLLMMTGRMIDATTAQAQGLVEELCAPGAALETAIAMAQEIAQTAPLTNGFVKAALSRGPMNVDELLALECDMQGLLFGTEDFQEGRTAFMEKRKPAFKGR
jgi:enoyl-CoA hydratase/carnithine racemase